jgi:hypothetical protein
MTHTNHALPSRAIASGNGSPRAAGSLARRRHASNFSDAVVAAYIHDISARHSHHPPPAAEASTASIRSASSARSAL